VDNDCDGLIDEDFVAVGDVVISEFLDDPWLVAAEDGEWVELYNARDGDVHLLGWSVTDASGLGFEIRQDVVVPTGGFAVLAASDDPDDNGQLPQVDYAYEYESFSLSSYEDDDIILMMGELEIDALGYSNLSSWPSAPGQSNFLSPSAYDATANDDVANWCSTPPSPAYEFGGPGGANYGTPGADNPPATDDVDGDGYTVCEGDCDDGDAAVHPEASEDCDDGVDNDCDGRIDDEDSDCVVGDDDSADDDTADDDATDDDSAADTEDCSCRMMGEASPPAVLATLGWLWLLRRGRR